MFNTYSIQSFVSTSKSSSESHLFSKIFADFNLSPTITAIKFDTFHNLIQKTQFKPKSCLVCLRPIKCGVKAVKCVDCSLHCHTKCERHLSIMCVEGRQPKVRNSCRTTKFRYPSKSPFIPPPILHLINEIELKIQAGLYCLPINTPEGTRAISGILRKFQFKKSQHLRRYNVHLLTNCLLEVLRELPSHVIRHWHISRTESTGAAGAEPPILNLDLKALPKPNRNVLILLLLHLQYVSRQEESTMSPKALATVFAPILIENEIYLPITDHTGQGQQELLEVGAQNLLLRLLELDSEYLLNLLLNS